MICLYWRALPEDCAIVTAVVCVFERDGSGRATASWDTPHHGNLQGSVAFQHLYPSQLT